MFHKDVPIKDKILTLETVSRSTHGFLPTDLILLVKKAIGHSGLQSTTVTVFDFKKAALDTVPSGLLDFQIKVNVFFIEIPSILFQDLWGLDAVISSVKVMIGSC